MSNDTALQGNNKIRFYGSVVKQATLYPHMSVCHRNLFHIFPLAKDAERTL